MAVETKTRGRVQEHKETLLLLEKWGDENVQLQLKSCTRKKPVWPEIAAHLRAAGYMKTEMTVAACKTRIHTLISAFITWQAPRAGSMRRFLCSDGLPERARWSDTARQGLPVLFPQIKFRQCSNECTKVFSR